MELYLALAIPILLATAWLYTAQISRTSLPNLQGKRICLLIAHPDDEAMFFSPTVLALTALAACGVFAAQKQLFALTMKTMHQISLIALLT